MTSESDNLSVLTWLIVIEKAQQGDFRALASQIRERKPIPSEYADAIACVLKERSTRGPRRLTPIQVAFIRMTYDVERKIIQARGLSDAALNLKRTKEELARLFKVSVATIEDVIYKRRTYST
ncbi:MAG: hypothetical protein MUC68_02955 [Burkholderiaceae bacterium]|nr:hypothetical protein [Burkholderiaceae bacterium]